jgi:cytoskeleton protein RodZ
MNAESTTNSEEVRSEQPFDGPGGLLRRERLAQGLKLEKVANQLHLSKQTLEQLEADDFEKLPGPVFIRGYLLNYARLLGLSDETVMGPFHHLCPEPEQGCLSSRSGSRMANEVQSSHGMVKLVSWLIVIGLGVLLVVWWQGRLEWRNAEEPTAQSVPAVKKAQREPAEARPVGEPYSVLGEAEPVSIPAPFAPAESDTPPADLDQPLVPMGGADEVALEPQVTEAEMSEVSLEGMPPPLEMAEPEPSPAPKPVAAPLVASGSLVFEFSDSCWVEVRGADGRARIFGEMQAGARRSVDAGLGPFRITLGNADVVKLTVAGQAYDLTPHTRGKVARFSLDPAAL